ncbi:MAG: hypothetical protein WCJ17_02090 [bacterium]
MKKLLIVMMCVFGFQSASYGFLGTALNTESEKAFLKSLETQSGMTDEQAKELLLKAARLQQRLHKWSATGAAISAVPVAIVIAFIVRTIRHLTIRVGDHVFHSGDVALIVLGPLMVLVLALSGLAFGKSLAASIKAKKRAANYKKMASRASQIKSYQRYTERLGFMGGFNEKNEYSSTWNTIAQGRQKVMKKGLNAQLAGTSLGALGAFISAVFFCKGPDRYNFFSAVAFAAFTLFSAYGLKGVARKQAMKKLMSEMKNEYSGARAIAQDPEAELLTKIAEWEREEAAAKTQAVV